MTKTEQERRQKLERLQYLIAQHARHVLKSEKLDEQINALKYELQQDPKPETK